MPPLEKLEEEDAGGEEDLERVEEAREDEAGERGGGEEGACGEGGGGAGAGGGAGGGFECALWRLDVSFFSFFFLVMAHR